MQDKTLITKRFAHSLKDYSRLAVVQQRIAERLAEKIGQIGVEPACGLEIGCGTGFLTKRLAEIFSKTHWRAIDLVEECRMYLPDSIDFSSGDGEFFVTAEKLDIIASSSTIQWFDSIANFISRAHNALNNNGIIAISTFGPDNFAEITATTSQSLRYHSLAELTTICTGVGFEILWGEEWREVLRFDSPNEVLHHIRATGVNALEPTRWTKSRLQKFNSDYIERFGEATLTFHPQIIICRKR